METCQRCKHMDKLMLKKLHMEVNPPMVAEAGEGYFYPKDLMEKRWAFAKKFEESSLIDRFKMVFRKK